MKLVIVGVNNEGKSIIEKDEEVPDNPQITLFEYDPNGSVMDVIAKLDTSLPHFGPQEVGAMHFSRGILPPLSEDTRPPGGEPIPGVDEDGWHTTPTVDYDFILDGELTLLADEGRTIVRAGDVVVMKAARHAWRNYSDKPATIVGVLIWPAT